MSLFRKPDDKDYDVLLAENRFITDLQVVLEKAMAARQLSQAELAKRMNISAARMSQILADDGANLEARTIARIAHALQLVAIIDLVDATSPKKVRIEKDAYSKAIKEAWADASTQLSAKVHTPTVKHANDDECLIVA